MRTNSTSILQAHNAPRIGLILSGGGSRAAYQVGVLCAIAEVLPPREPNPFHVVSGTSAGALNAAALASHAWRFRAAVRNLEYVWKNLRSEQVYDPESVNLLSRAPGVLLSMLGTSRNNGKPVALVDNHPLRTLLTRVIRFPRIQRNIDAGLLDALSVTCSTYGSGESVSFYQAMHGFADWSGPHRISRRARIGIEHLMASSAIPLIFPPVRLDAQYYGDGAVRQLAPISTALKLGARRLLVIGVSGNRSNTQPVNTKTDEPPTLLQMMGHVMNSAFVDTLEHDIETLQKINEMLSLLPAAARARMNPQLNEIELLEIFPSRDLNALANDFADELPKPLSRYIKPGSSGTILSLILFERGFCRALMELGYEDAMEREQQIREFFEAVG